jgi:hypothetical protein
LRQIQFFKSIPYTKIKRKEIGKQSNSLGGIMKLIKTLTEAMHYVSAAVGRIFGPTDDAYPETGVQPFEGEPNKNRRAD